VTDPIISRFGEACGAIAPLDLAVDLVDGQRQVKGTVRMPFSLIGRDDACDVTLADPEVNPRHAWLQVVGGRVLAVDLGSRNGLGWPGQGTGSGWLDVGVPVRIGPFQLRLCSPVATQPVRFPPRYNPLQSDHSVQHRTTTYHLEFRNGKRAKDRWGVNRLVTLVGRAPECKIRLNADDIAAYHCGLVLTTCGLWVVDLSGRGVVVNGERMRVSPLHEGAELWIGRFLIGLTAHAAGDLSSAVGSTRTLRQREAATQSPSPLTWPTTEVPEDEVPVGTVPPQDPLAGFPSSHIMAEAFLVTGGAGGGVSNPILVSESKQPLMSFAGSSFEPPHGRPLDREEAREGTGADPLKTATVAALLRELGELHGEMLSHFERSLGLMARLFASVGPDQLPAIQQELARIQDLNSELSKLQTELAHRAADNLPNPAPPPRPAQLSPTGDSTALHDWVADRIGSLQKERQARWHSLVGKFSATESRKS